MSVPAKLGAYVAVLALALVAGAGLGAAVGPIDTGGSDPAHTTDPPAATDHDAEIHDGGHGS
jgi:hypothetical protein